MIFDKEFLLCFGSSENLIRFSCIYPDYYSLSKNEFECDSLFFVVLPVSVLDDVRHFLYNHFHIHDYDICYPVAIQLEPLIV